MSLLDRISARAASLSVSKAAPAAAVKAPPWALRAAVVEGQTIPDPESFDRQARLYTRLSWIQIAISAVAQSAAGVKLSVERRSGEGSTAIANHPFEVLLQKPNPDQSRFEFLEAHYS